MVVGCVFMLYFQIKNKKMNWFYVIGTGLCLAALLLSFTRSTYGAAFVALALAAGLYLMTVSHISRKLLSHLSLTLVTIFLVVALQQSFFKANYISFAFARTLSINIATKDGDGNGESSELEDIKDALKRKQEQSYIDRTKESDNNIRATTLADLSVMISHNPVFGNGLGAAISSRDDGLVEYFYYDILNKMGIVGLLLYYFPIGYMGFQLIQAKKRKDTEWSLILIGCFCGLTAFIAATYFNPYMNASIGISCYSICIAAFWAYTKSQGANISSEDKSIVLQAKDQK